VDRDQLEAVLTYAFELAEQGDSKRALENVQKTLDAGWFGAELALFKSTLEYRLGELDAARRSVAAALGFDPINGLAFQALAEIYIAKGRFARAQKAIAEAIRLDRANAYNHVVEAKIFDHQAWLKDSPHLVTRAIESWRLAVAIAPDSAPIRVEFANYLSLHGRRSEALEHAQKALEIAPDWFAPHAVLAAVALARGDSKTARAHLRNAEAIDASPPYVALLKAQIDGRGSVALRWLIWWAREVFARPRYGYIVGLVPLLLAYQGLTSSKTPDWYFWALGASVIPLLLALAGLVLARVHSRPSRGNELSEPDDRL